MSSGSYFKIVRKHKNCIIPTDSANLLKQLELDEGGLSKQTVNSLFIPVDSFSAPTRVDYDSIFLFDIRDNCMCDELMELHFISSFTQLKEHWNMNAYDNSKSIKEIDYPTMLMLLGAAEYLLLGEYNKKIEAIMHNPFIRVLGENYPTYYKFGKPKTADDRDPSVIAEIEELNSEMNYFITNLKDACISFKSAHEHYMYNNKYEIKLLYYAY